MSEPDQLVEMLRTMLRIRTFEERLSRYYSYSGFFANETAAAEAKSAEELLTCVSYEFTIEGMIGGAVHLSVGQEAVSTGVCANLRPDDAAFSSHRSHGHFIAKGGTLKEALAELMGREGGCSRGHGGSMHLFDPAVTFLGGNGIIGAQLTLALGPAFAAKYHGTDAVSVPFFGDGGANQGTFNEALNLASLWQLPVVFVCENNLWANATPAAISFADPDIAHRAAGYNMPGVTVDGQDVLAVHEAAREAVERARTGGGPTLLEMKTYRFYGHCGGASGHADPAELARWRERDPIAMYRQRLLGLGVLTESEAAELEAEVAAEMDEAEAYAKASPLPTAATRVREAVRAQEAADA